MAIQIEKSSDPKKITITLDNGHVEALEKIVNDYKLKGEEQAVGFMLAVLKDADGKKIEIDGTTYLPSDNIKRGSEAQFEDQ